MNLSVIFTREEHGQCLELNVPFYIYKSLTFRVRFHYQCGAEDWVMLAIQVHYVLLVTVVGAYTKTD